MHFSVENSFYHS